MKRLYVGNLPWGTTNEELKDAFAEFGYPAADAKIITDRETGKSRGFGFVTLAEGVDGAEAIANLNGYNFGGRQLTVNEAKEQTPRGRSGGGGGGGDHRGGGGDRDRRGGRGGRDERRGRYDD